MGDRTCAECGTRWGSVLEAESCAHIERLRAEARDLARTDAEIVDALAEWFEATAGIFADLGDMAALTKIAERARAARARRGR